jgi:uncharacterized protein
MPTLSPDRIRLHVRVAPGAPHAGVVGRHGDGWKVRVAAPAADGRANEALCALLADVLGVRREALRIVTGAGARDKLVEVRGRERAAAERLLAAAAETTR